MASLLSLEDCLPAVAVISLMPGMRTAFLAIPEVQRLQAALRETKFYIVGGAVRDLLRNPGEIPKDIDCQVCLPTKEDILSLVRGHYEDEEIKLQPLAVSVGSATDTLDGIDLLPAHYNFDSAAVENDVNSLMFDLDAGSLIDPFGTGFCNLSAGHFRIVASDMEAWYSYPIPGRSNNGKAPRVLKMLHMGLTFAEPQQQEDFLDCLRSHFPKDLEEKVVNSKFSAWAVVLGMNIRGDTFNWVTGEVHVGMCPLKLAKYEGCLTALLRMDYKLGSAVKDYMSHVTVHGCFP